MVYATNLFTAARVKPTDDLRAPSRSGRLFSESDAARFRVTEERVALTREQVIARIIELNPTATGGFLETFSDGELSSYLDHLSLTLAPRNERSRWCRPAGVPAVHARSAWK